MNWVLVKNFKSFFVQRKELFSSRTHLSNIFDRGVFKRLIDCRFIEHNIKACRILILNQMIKFTFKNGLIGITLTFPVFDKKFFDARLLLLKSLHCNLLAVRQIDSIEVFTGFSLFIFGDFLIYWLSHFFNVEVKQVKLFFFLFISRSLFFLFSIGAVRIHLCNFFHF